MCIKYRQTQACAAELCCDMSKTTLADVVTKVLKKKLNTNEPTVLKGDEMLHEEGEHK